MKKFQELTLLMAAIACLAIAYYRYFILSYGWRSPAILVAISAVFLFQIWELEKPEKELTMNELMEEMKEAETGKSKWNFQTIISVSSWVLFLGVAVWIGNNTVILGVVVAMFFSLVQIALGHYEQAKKDDKALELIKKIDELSGNKDEKES